ncbi:MAG: DUF3501 family protein [Stenotrophobium sp.]
MSNRLTINDLMKLEDYAAQRQAFRARVLEHKRGRKLHLGEHLTLLFEDRLTVQYQVQEMLRIERIFERAGIQEELDAYNPLIPDGHNWKATCLIEYDDERERHIKLTELKDVEHLVWVQVEGQSRVLAIADEDMDRSNQQKTSAVHFMRFELTPEMIATLRGGASLQFGVDHPRYRHVQTVPTIVRAALLVDLQG